MVTLFDEWACLLISNGHLKEHEYEYQAGTIASIQLNNDK